MKFRQKFKKLKKQAKEQKHFMLLDEALKKLVELGIATTVNKKYEYSPLFTQTAQIIILNPPGKLKQIKLANEAGRKLIPQILTMATTKPSRRDIENIITGFVCLKIHVEKQNLNVDKSLVPDLAYAVWYLNDHNPTVQEVEEWK